MKPKTFFLLGALLAPPAIRAQTPSPTTQQNPSAPATAQPARPANLDDDPEFKKLSPEQKAWVRQMTERLNKAVNDKDTAAIDQLTQEAAKHQQESASANAVPHYVYQANASNNSATTNPPPANPASSSPCAVAPKKPGFLDKLKQHAQRTLEAQAGKADAKINKASKGNVDAGVKDTATSAVNDANQTAPCPPVKGQSAKQ